MKQKIVAYVKAHPKSRLREIGAGLGVWHCSLIKDVHELVGAGILTVEQYSDPANMERYNLYSVRKK